MVCPGCHGPCFVAPLSPVRPEDPSQPADGRQPTSCCPPPLPSALPVAWLSGGLSQQLPWVRPLPALGKGGQPQWGPQLLEVGRGLPGLWNLAPSPHGYQPWGPAPACWATPTPLPRPPCTGPSVLAQSPYGQGSGLGASTGMPRRDPGGSKCCSWRRLPAGHLVFWLRAPPSVPSLPLASRWALNVSSLRCCAGHVATGPAWRGLQQPREKTDDAGTDATFHG